MKIPSGSIQAAGLTEVGLQRERNEDAYHADDLLGLFVVADGMGGHSAGDVASRMAVDLIIKSFSNWTNAEAEADALFGFPDPSLSKVGNYVKSSIDLANRVIYEVAALHESYQGMGTTVAVLAMGPHQVICANVGDSRIYRVRDGRIERLSKDHTVVAQQVEMGIMTRQEAQDSSLKHVLTKNLGSSMDIGVEITEVEPEERDRFLLCTDGLTDLLTDGEILDMVQAKTRPDALCDHLVQAALQWGGHDNITVISVFLNLSS
jgi:serine/threonine protein phosphatase PrpC